MLPFSLLLVPLAWGIYGYVKTRKGPTLDIKSKTGALPAIINSGVLYALAFNIIFFIQELFLALGKRWLGLKAYLYHNNHNWEGEHPMEGLAQGYGAAAILITGIICLLIVRSMKNNTHWLYVFFLWMAFQGFAQSLPQFITAMAAPDTDTGQAFTYLKIGNTLGLVISVVCIFFMLWMGSAYSKFLLRLAPSTDYTANASSRFGYLFRIALLASLIGIILIIPFRIMPWDRAIAPVMVTLISVPMVFANAWKVKPLITINSSINKKIIVLPVILLVILLFIFQFILAKGVEM